MTVRRCCTPHSVAYVTPAAKRISGTHSLTSGIDVWPMLVSAFDGASVLAQAAAVMVNVCNMLKADHTSHPVVWVFASVASDVRLAYVQAHTCAPLLVCCYSLWWCSWLWRNCGGGELVEYC